MLPLVATNNIAPDDLAHTETFQKDGFCVIMELTKQEKQELLLMWAERFKDE